MAVSLGWNSAFKFDELITGSTVVRGMLIIVEFSVTGLKVEDTTVSFPVDSDAFLDETVEVLLSLLLILSPCTSLDFWSIIVISVMLS
jgi:hypothetical protein